jgi:hypothetical protein
MKIRLNSGTSLVLVPSFQFKKPLNEEVDPHINAFSSGGVHLKQMGCN